MKSIAEMYCSEVKKDTQIYFAQWLPNATIELGTVGVLHGDVFIPKTSLQEEGITGIGEVADPSSTPLDIQSHKDVKVALKLAGQVSTGAPSIPQANAGVVVEFGHQGAYVIKAAASYEPRLGNVARLEDEILARYKAGKWKKEWVVVSQLVRTPKASILVSQTSSAKVEITAQGDATVGQAVKLGDVKFSFDITSEAGKVYNFLDSNNVTPLFQLVGVKRRFLGKTNVGTLDYRAATVEIDAVDLDEHEEPRDVLYLGRL